MSANEQDNIDIVKEKIGNYLKRKGFLIDSPFEGDFIKWVGVYARPMNRPTYLDANDSEEAEDQPQEKRFIKINVKLVLLLFVILVLIILLIFLIRKKRKQRRYRSRYGTPTGRTPKRRRRRRRSLLGRRRSSYDRNSSIRYHRTPKNRNNHSKFNL